MSAFFVANVEVLDREKFQQYSQKAGETIANHGGERIIRGFAQNTLTGISERCGPLIAKRGNV